MSTVVPDEVEPTSSPDVAAPSARRGVTRREFVGLIGGAAVGAAAAYGALEVSRGGPAAPEQPASYRNGIQPFYGLHQGGVTTPTQSATHFAAVDLITERRSDVEDLLRAWTPAIERLTRGRPIAEPGRSSDAVDPDDMTTLGLGPSNLTVNVGFGAGLFELDGVDRYGLAHRRPSRLIDLPVFNGDRLIPQKVGGDLTIQACADDPQVALHAVRQLLGLAEGVARVRWVQSGFNEASASPGTPRNLMGFKDGTINPVGDQLDRFVWVGSEGPDWMLGGTYAVYRRIRITLEAWDSLKVSDQQRIVGREKVSGAPLGRTNEFDPLDLDATDRQGDLYIMPTAHVRLAAPQTNYNQMILRRGYSYDDGLLDDVGPDYDAGLFFCCYQRDPQLGFFTIFQQLADGDALLPFTIHTGSAIVALPPAPPSPGHVIGEGLFA